ncbi:hypothetical protein [Christiangramia crocea]|uniref:Uncharacterized protein n=1 Tax=Christiangramia crocea TaxID=2904124 RepID=A0A9X1UVE5_9FLAO|nr:hypothetical protein [Gramella crocea]MCG9971034.1 hypothetical protein [Gramella crocea]
METISKDRVKEIEAILTNYSFDIEVDANEFPECVGIEHEEKGIYLYCFIRFDGSNNKEFYLKVNKKEEKLTSKEQDIILKKICQVHRNEVKNYEEKKREESYNDMIAQDELQNIDHINYHFHRNF